jgi:hypothetical protein
MHGWRELTEREALWADKADRAELLAARLAEALRAVYEDPESLLSPEAQEEIEEALSELEEHLDALET